MASITHGLPRGDDDRSPGPISSRPPRPVPHPVMLQGWHDLTALHWPYPAAEVERLLPAGFGVDTVEGSAWVGLIPFRMRRIRLPGLPSLGPLSNFPEMNVRTYIVDPNGRRGVWFFSLDVTALVPALVARATYRLPYCWASMSLSGRGDGDGGERTIESVRRWPSGAPRCRIDIHIGPAIDPSSVNELDRFLSARWALGTAFGHRLAWARVEHPEWPLHQADVHQWDETYFEAAGLRPPRGEPHVRWSPGVDVRIERPRLLAD
jgi:uncharacterized protein YqjF (DUF2071 family)